jgi:hypothetical protein
MLMEGFPPAPDTAVTLANWQQPPYNRWAFSHLREIVPTQRIARGSGGTLSLPSDPKPLADPETLRSDGTVATVGAVLDTTYTDGVVVVHRNRTVLERYAGATDRDTTHLLMSITTVVGCVVGNLVARGVLSTEQLVTEPCPSSRGAGTAGRGCGICSTCARGSGSASGTTTPTQGYASSNRLRCGNREGATTLRRRSTATFRRSSPPALTVGCSSTAPARPTCWAGCANALPAPGWRTSLRAWCGRGSAPSVTRRSPATPSVLPCTTAACALRRPTSPASGSCCSRAASWQGSEWFPPTG